MSGIGFQELLLIFILLVLYGILSPGLTYLLALLGMKLLRSPRRVLVAFWVLNVLAAGFETSGDPYSIVVWAFLSPAAIALWLAWLWVLGWLCQRMGLSRVGTKFRDMAELLLGSVRRGGGIRSEPVIG